MANQQKRHYLEALVATIKRLKFKLDDASKRIDDAIEMSDVANVSWAYVVKQVAMVAASNQTILDVMAEAEELLGDLSDIRLED